MGPTFQRIFSKISGSSAIGRLRPHQWNRWLVALAAPLLLVSCTAIEKTTIEKPRYTGIEPKNNSSLNLKVVLKAVPRHLLPVPRTDAVWLWDKPGGPGKRAMRIKKVPSGTPGRVLEYEPESTSAFLWAQMNYVNHLREPIRWVRVVTSHGMGWVRREFIEPR